MPFDANNLATYPTQFTQSIADPNVDLDDDIYAFFVQDTWRVRTDLTISMGVRYDRENAFSRIVGVPDDTNNIAPRLGVIWDPFKDGRTAIRGGYGLYIDQVFLNPPLNVVLAQRANDVTIINPGYPDPFTRGTVQSATPSISVSSENIRTPESKSVSLGVKRELTPAWRCRRTASTAAATTSSTTAISTRAIRSPVTRPNPNYLRITQYETEGHAWYSALLMSLERRGAAGSRLRRVVHAGQGDSRRRRVPVPGAGSVESGGREVAGQQQPHAPGRRPHELARCPAGFQLAGIVQYRSGSPWNVTTGRDSNLDTEQNDRPDLVNPDGDPYDRNTYYGDFTERVGNLGRNANIGPSFVTLDVRLSKLFTMQRYGFEGSSRPSTRRTRSTSRARQGNLRSSLFGTSTSIQGNQRQVELGFRVDF